MHILEAIPSEAKIKKILIQSVFGKRPFCPRCGSSHIHASEHRYTCPRCRKPFSLTSVSWLKGMKITYRELWLLLYCWQKKIPFHLTLEMTKLSHITVRRWRRRFQKYMVYESPILKGLVEMDEAFLGKRRTGNQQIVLGAWSRRDKKVVLRCAPDREQGTTDRFILRYIDRRDTSIFTDCAPCYEGIDAFFGYEHFTCNHSQYVFGPTNLIENIWSRVRRFIIRIYHHFHKKWLPLLLREFEARINNPELFESPLSFLQISLYAVPSR
jgi:transposase-like protein